jgi:CelD/BcsL family acetyltransferase involved in cellulose biosynthesis
MPQSGELTVEEVRSEAALQALADEWDNLLTRSESNVLFLTHAWVTCWWRHFGRVRGPLRQATLFVLTVRQHGRLCGIAPLILDVECFLGVSIRLLRFLGHGVSDYVDFMLAENREALLQAIVQHLATRATDWDAIDLRDFAGASPNFSPLCRLLTAAGLVWQAADDHACPFLPVQGSWDSYYQSRFNRHHRKEHRREWRALAAVGQPHVRFVTSLEKEPALWDRLATLDEHHPEAGPQRAAFFALADYRGFFEDMLPQAAQRGWLTLALLECDGLAVAYYLGFQYNRRYYIYITSYHGDFSRFGVGKLLMLRMLEQYWAAEGDDIDFLRGDEPHKNRWAAQLRSNQRLLVWQRAGRSWWRQQLWFFWLPALQHWSPRLHGFLQFFSASSWSVMRQWACRRLQRAVLGEGRETHNEHR